MWKIRWPVALAVVVLALVIAWVLFVPGADWLAHHDVGSAKGPLHQTAVDAARGRLLTLGAGLFAAGALLFTARNFTLAREGQVTDRYTKAIEQLGSEKLDVRIGGIYALERVARDSARDHPTVMEVLTAFVREHSHERWPPSDPAGQERARSARPDIQAAVTVVGRGAYLFRADLTGADLHVAKLDVANLHRAVLIDTDLTGADLRGATLTQAYLTGADLNRADLHSATLTEAYLRGANLTGANLTGANLTGAVLGVTDTFRAILRGATLTQAYIVGGHPTDADLTGADLTGASSGGLETRHRLWPTGESRHWLRADGNELTFVPS